MEINNLNEDWLEKLNEKLVERNRLLQEFAQKQIEENNRTLEALDNLKKVMLDQINKMRANRGEDPIQL